MTKINSYTTSCEIKYTKNFSKNLKKLNSQKKDINKLKKVIKIISILKH